MKIICFLSFLCFSTLANALEWRWTQAFNDSDFAKITGLRATNWLNVGFTFNPDHPNNGFNGPVTFNDRDRELQLNQFYLALERPFRKDLDEWQLGGRLDVLFGSDAVFTQTYGDPNGHWDLRLTNNRFNNLALPQAYLEVFAPYGEGISIKIGHFYTIIGTESVMAPDNFFYTHTYTEQYGEPFTHSGALVEIPWTNNKTGWLRDWKITTRLGTITGGETAGWDAGMDRGLDVWRFLGGVGFQSPDDATSLSLAATVGAESARVDSNWNLYSIVYKQQVLDLGQLLLQFDHGWVDASSNRAAAEWHGAEAQFTMPVNDELEAGLRFEWFHDANDFRVQNLARLAVKLSESGHFIAATAGLKWQPLEGLVFRPNLRFDLSNDTRPFDDGQSHHQWLLSMDMILSI